MTKLFGDILNYLRIKKPKEIGFVDIIREDYVAGWAKSNIEEHSKLKIFIFYDDKKIGETTARDYRADLEVAGYGDGKFAYSFTNLPRIVDIKKLQLKTSNGTELRINTNQIEKSQGNDMSIWSNWDDNYLLKHETNLGEYSNKCKKNDINNFVVIIGDLNLDQCKKYRVQQKVEIFNRLGIKSNISHWEDIQRSLSLLELATTVIFYRIPNCKLTTAYLNEATRLNINIGYDIDDPIFDSQTYSKNVNLKYLHPNEQKQLVQNAKYYAAILRQCDFITTSTPALKSLISNYTSAPISLWRNLMDSQSLNALTYAQNTTDEKSKDPNQLVLGYMSGSRAHEADFKVAFNAIHEVMDTHENISLLIVGHAEMAKQIKKTFRSRVKLVPFSNYFDYISYYTRIDVNLIPLVQNQFNDCKSAIRYLESSLLKKPTIVSKIGDFCNIVTDKVDGLLVSSNSENEWIKSLEFAINNREKVNEIGAAAYKNVMANYTTKNIHLNKDYIRIINNEE